MKFLINYITILFLVLLISNCETSKSDFSNEFKEGEEKLKNEDYESALVIFNQILTEDPKNINAYKKKITALNELGHFNEAKIAVNDLFQIDSTDLESIKLRMKVNYYTNNFIAAIYDMDKILEKNQSDTLVLKLRAIINFQLGNYEKSNSDVDKLLRLTPNDPVLYSLKGMYLLDLGLIEEAKENFNRSLEIFDQDAIVYCNLGSIEENFEKSVNYFNTAIKINPQYADSYFFLGERFMKNEMYKDAILNFNKAIDLNYSNQFASYYNRAYSKLNYGDYRGAIKDYEKVIEIDNTIAEAFLLLGSAKYQIDDLDGACKAWHKSFDLGNPSAIEFISNYCK
ncbi:MAG: tetratricopeptide repeat protein [Melioribacteraceae bacterium]|nr:tetratricopeptide repeat protein [Melioribacteraceae bacterium]